MNRGFHNLIKSLLHTGAVSSFLLHYRAVPATELRRVNLETLFERNRRRYPAGETLTAYVEDSGDVVEETESAGESGEAVEDIEGGSGEEAHGLDDFKELLSRRFFVTDRFPSERHNLKSGNLGGVGEDEMGTERKKEVQYIQVACVMYIVHYHMYCTHICYQH
ncbi:hypothetical protein YC2023_100887 [Brassica napus]